MALLEKLEIVIEADAKNAQREFERIGQRASESFGEIEDAAGKVGDNASRKLAGASSKFAAAGRDLSDAAGRELDLSAAADKAAADVPRALKDQKDEAARAGGEVADSFGGGLTGGIGGALGGLSEGLDDALSSLPAGLGGPALAVGAAAGAAMVQGFVTAVERGQIDSQFEAALGVNESTAARMGETAGDIYSNNFGESIQQVAESMRLVGQNFAGLGDMSEAELVQVNEAALTLSAVFDQDLRSSITAAAQLMRNGLAKDSTEAFDIITAGLQGSANKADDLLDTFNEYSTMFRDIGIDGQQALGLITQAVEAGARDADTAADALKEFAIRGQDNTEAVAAGFERIGLNAEVMTGRIAAGGDLAEQALRVTLDKLREMEDPVQRNAAAVELFGTKAEDLGDALYAMDLDTAVAQLGAVDGKAKDAANSFDDMGSKVQQLGREFKTEMGQAFTDVLAPLAVASDNEATFEDFGKSVATGIERGMNFVPFSDVLGGWLDRAGIAGNNSVAENVTDWLFGQEVEPPKGLMHVLEEVRAARENGDPILDLDSIAGQAPAAVASLEDINREIQLSNDLFDLASDRAGNYLQRIGDSTGIDNMLSSVLDLDEAMANIYSSGSIGNLSDTVDIGAIARDSANAAEDTTAVLREWIDLGGKAQAEIASVLEFQGADQATARAGMIRDELVGMMEDAGYTEQQIKDLLEVMGLTEGQVDIAIELSGADEALAKLDLLQSRFEENIPKTLQTQIDVAIAEGRFVDAANALSMWVKDQEDGSISDPLLVAMGLGDTTSASLELFAWKLDEQGKPPVTIAVDAATSAARAQAAALFNDVQRLNPKMKVNLVANFANLATAIPIFANGFGGADGNPNTPRATGGPVMAGASYQVNEVGSEMFVPSTGGFVMDHSESAALVAGVRELVAGGGNGVNVTQTIVTADPVVAGSESARKMRDAAFLAGV